MVTDLQARKADIAFEHFDTDGNGHLEHDDFIALADRILAAFGTTKADPRGKACVAAFDDLWNTFVAELDTDGDQRISREEWRSALPKVFERRYREVTKAVHDIIDTDGDGFVSLAEYRTFHHEVFGTPVDVSEKVFRQLDVEGRGKLSVEKMTEVAMQFYAGTDPDVEGNAIFGPLR